MKSPFNKIIVNNGEKSKMLGVGFFSRELTIKQFI